DPNATNPPTPVVEAVTVSVAGPNGRLEIVLGNTGKNRVISASRDAIITELADGSIQVQAVQR
ncbi:MAG: hypothetical protein ACI80V_001972, partial [Rhodothermales bacterium]